MDQIKKIENPYATFWLEEGILFGEYKPGLSITLEIAKSFVADRLKISNGISRPFFLDIRQLVYADLASRKYLSCGDGTAFISAGAFLVGGPVSLFLTRIFFSINRPAVPVRTFTDKKNAVTWLKKYK